METGYSVYEDHARDLYNLCDLENKGYVTKDDLHRLQAHLGLSVDQLETVFESLDDDRNGYLTLDEFTNGFGQFMGSPTPADTGQDWQEQQEQQEQQEEDAEVEEEQFRQTLSHLGAADTIEEAANVDNVRELWVRIRKNHPELLTGFEHFIGRVSSELHKSKHEFKNLESALRTKTTAHDEEVRKLYEEMEHQMKTEKERLLSEERVKERQMREELEREIREKDKHYHEVLRHHEEMQAKMDEINLTHADTAQEKERLEKEHDELESKLEETERSLQDCQEYIEELNKKARDERRKRAKAAIEMTEGIALERETLVRQLDSLRDMNKRLKDERDEKLLRMMNGGSFGDGGETINFGKMGAPSDDENEDEGEDQLGPCPPVAPTQAYRGRTEKRGSVLSSYFTSGFQGSHDDADGEGDEDAEECTIIPAVSVMSTAVPKEDEEPPTKPEPERIIEQVEVIKEKIVYVETRPPVPETSCMAVGTDVDEVERMEVEIQTDRPPTPPPPAPLPVEKPPPSPRRVSRAETLPKDRSAPDGAYDDYQAEHIFRGPRSPERVFKVVFIGDSSVGKSSIIYRFCNDSFKSTFAATIGVDFQIKSMAIGDYLIALQLWDTAGQERFRSITKQYFRKADGVVVVYDVTSEISFLNVRSWMQSVQEGTEEGTVILLLGNKYDLTEEAGRSIRVKTKNGEMLANEYGTLFYEVSAKTGHQVPEAFRALSELLKDKEDRDLKNAIRVSTDIEKKKGCCGK